GTWEPLGDPHAMLAKGDLKFRLRGKKLNGEFVLAKMRLRRPGAKGTEWLLIKKKDEAAQPGFDIDKLDFSALTNQSLAQIAGDQGSAEWESNRKTPVNKGAMLKGAEWLFEDDTKKPDQKANRNKAGGENAPRKKPIESKIRKSKIGKSKTRKS